jgi:phage-related protein
LVKHIDGKLWELRRASSGNIYRIMYFFFDGRRIVFVHGFQKKHKRLPGAKLKSLNSE